MDGITNRAGTGRTFMALPCVLDHYRSSFHNALSPLSVIVIGVIGVRHNNHYNLDTPLDS